MHSVRPIDDWLSKRRVTASLVALFVVWYAVQLVTLQRFGADTAVWWFYFTRGDFGPGFALTPGLGFSAISHDMSDISHLGANVAALVVVGCFAEPYIERRTYLFVLIGVGFAGISFSNALAIVFHSQWSLAGASAGLLALHAYVSLRKRLLLTSITPFRSIATAEWFVVSMGLMTIPVVPIYELTVSGNVGHALGPILGSIAYLVHLRTSPRRLE